MRAIWASLVLWLLLLWMPQRVLAAESLASVVSLCKKYVASTKDQRGMYEFLIVSHANNLPGYRHELMPVTKGDWWSVGYDYALKALPEGDWTLYKDHEVLLGPKDDEALMQVLKYGKNKQIIKAFVIFLDHHVVLVDSQSPKTTYILTRLRNGQAKK